ncbi:L,D-transpeptidase [Paracoccus sp. TK19116]|uniref:L,D-transpeptidase n=1 Tax=Paracoccus albicereus TaxID=2922394 RepID=A0ABT1MU99_9RHOB|nr:L,D-transpeptidase [Paracoccus albicereus]MCQ0971254.1 L,D-transpeptidase [Paracoccus albicereus]
MRRAAGAFSALSIAAALTGGWILIQPMVIPPVPIPLPPIVRPLPQIEAPLTGPIDRIVIDKGDRRLDVFRDGRRLKTYRVALGFSPEGDKTRQGDGRTPEGVFRVDRRNPSSAYHLSLGIDYPQADDRAAARAAGVDPGGDIFIHGQPNQRPDGEVLAGDWTAGCIALSDAEIRELWDATPDGTPVEILP